MPFLDYDKKFELFDQIFLKENYKEILSLTEYLPQFLRSFLMELNINYSHTPNNNDVQQYSIHRKKIYSRLYDEKKAELMDLTELLVFLSKHPNFEKMIKDDDLLEEWVNYCERTYSVDIFDYVESYEDIENLIK